VYVNPTTNTSTTTSPATSPTSQPASSGSPATGGNAVVHNTVAPPPVLPQSDPALRTVVTSPVIDIVNNSTVLSDAQIKAAIVDLQIQLDRDFAPAWGVNATLEFVAKGTTHPATHWVLAIFDTSDQEGALGYHDITSAGLPVGKVFVKDDMKYGLSWTVTLSHEVLEMIIDPYISNCVFVQNSNTTGMLYAYEVCDPVEDDSLGYKINNTLVSDFVYPAWFEGFRKANSTKFDFKNAVTKPFQLAKGGYISQFVVGPNSRGWDQLTANSVPTARNRKGTNSRMMRRRLARKPKTIAIDNTNIVD
jgi:hypothetical protein